MFTAMKTSGGWMAGEVKGFDKSIVNIGHNFDLSTGIFKTPIDGYYSFSFTGFVYEYYVPILNIRKNDQNTLAIKAATGSNIGGGAGYFATTWYMILSKNDKINLYVSGSSSSNLLYNTGIVFSGLFIRPL